MFWRSTKLVPIYMNLQSSFSLLFDARFCEAFLFSVCYRCHMLHKWIHNQQKEPVSVIECRARLSNMAHCAVQVISLCTILSVCIKKRNTRIWEQRAQQTEHFSRDKPAFIHSFIHSLVCIMTHSQSIAKPVLHRGWSSTSFNFQYHIFS